MYHPTRSHRAFESDCDSGVRHDARLRRAGATRPARRATRSTLGQGRLRRRAEASAAAVRRGQQAVRELRTRGGAGEVPPGAERLGSPGHPLQRRGRADQPRSAARRKRQSRAGVALRRGAVQFRDPPAGADVPQVASRPACGVEGGLRRARGGRRPRWRDAVPGAGRGGALADARDTPAGGAQTRIPDRNPIAQPLARQARGRNAGATRDRQPTDAHRSPLADMETMGGGRRWRAAGVGWSAVSPRREERPHCLRRADRAEVPADGLRGGRPRPSGAQRPARSGTHEERGRAFAVRRRWRRRGDRRRAGDPQPAADRPGGRAGARGGHPAGRARRRRPLAGIRALTVRTARRPAHRAPRASPSPTGSGRRASSRAPGPSNDRCRACARAPGAVATAAPAPRMPAS